MCKHLLAKLLKFHNMSPSWAHVVKLQNKSLIFAMYSSVLPLVHYSLSFRVKLSITISLL